MVAKLFQNAFKQSYIIRICLHVCHFFLNIGVCDCVGVFDRRLGPCHGNICRLRRDDVEGAWLTDLGLLYQLNWVPYKSKWPKFTPLNIKGSRYTTGEKARVGLVEKYVGSMG